MPESVPCNLCGSAERLPKPKIARLLDIREPFGVCRCSRCGLVYLTPRPTVAEYATMYATHPYYSAANAMRGAPRRGFYALRMERLERWRPQRGTMLVIGCLEGGHALEVAQNRGWQVLGIEFSEILATYARERLGVQVEIAKAWDLSGLIGRSFNAIYTHSLEHLPDPRATLRQCHNLLTQDGLLMIEVPNAIRSLKQKLKGAMITLADSKVRRLFCGQVGEEFHPYFFEPGTIKALLRTEKFEMLDLRTYLPRHPVYLSNPRVRWLQELLYAVGGLVERGPSIEIIARPVT